MKFNIFDFILSIKKRPIMGIFIVVAVSAVIGLCSTLYLGKDNPIEQAAEEVIKSETGINIDLTPEK